MFSLSLLEPQGLVQLYVTNNLLYDVPSKLQPSCHSKPSSVGKPLLPEAALIIRKLFLTPSLCLHLYSSQLSLPSGTKQNKSDPSSMRVPLILEESHYAPPTPLFLFLFCNSTSFFSDMISRPFKANPYPLSLLWLVSSSSGGTGSGRMKFERSLRHSLAVSLNLSAFVSTSTKLRTK